jgi:PAS domain S-box-containing protein
MSCLREATSGSGFVSPEQSEDGLQPRQETPSAAPVAAPTFNPRQPMLVSAQTSISYQGMTPQQMHQGMTNVPAPSSFPTLPAHVPASMPPIPVMIVHNHAAPAPTFNMDMTDAKRRRVDVPSQVYAGSLATTTQPMFGNAQMLGHNTMPGRGRQKSQAQIDRRRERNRILARRTRLRKKFFFEGLQKDVNDLQRENTILKDLVKKNFSPEAAEQLLSECNAMESLPKAVHDAVFENSDLDGQDFNLVRSIQRSQQCFIITDPSLQDNPIVYASDDFLNLTGYDREEVLGRNCRFLQGTETSAQKVELVRKAVALGEDVSVTMINYTADGNAFWNKLFIAALRDSNNNIVNFIGVIVKVAAPEPDDPEAGKLLPGQQASSVNGDADMGDEDDDDDDDDVAQMFC